ncbi:MAG: RICIN domain-containing protein [Pirellulales bacterium]
MQNHFTSKTFSGKGGNSDDANCIVQVPYDVKLGKRPDWKFVKVENNMYQIVDAKSGRVLTAVKPSGERETYVILDDWDKREEQLWELMDAPKRLVL